MVTITDEITGKSVTIEKYEVVDVLRGWYENAPDEVRSAVVGLERALLQGEQTDDLEAYLAVRVERI